MAASPAASSATASAPASYASSEFLFVEDILAQRTELPSVDEVSSGIANNLLLVICIPGRRRTAKKLGVLLCTLNEDFCVAGRRRHERGGHNDDEKGVPYSENCHLSLLKLVC